MVQKSIMAMASQHQVPRSHIVIDQDGVGGGVVDNLRGVVGFENTSSPINKENYPNLKTQCFYQLSKDIRQIYVVPGVATREVDGEPLADLITQELQAVQRGDIKTLDGKLTTNKKSEQKEILGRSPDFADALMMRTYFELKPIPQFSYSSVK